MAKKTNLMAIFIVIVIIAGLLILPNLSQKKSTSDVTDVVEEDNTENQSIHIDLETLKSAVDKNYYEKYKGENRTVIVYNWGEYISDGTDESLDVNKAFTDITGIKVNYVTFSTNEELYAKLKSGNAGYDVIIPSDYMIGRMIKEDMVQTLDHSQIPNIKNLEERFKDTAFDPGDRYSLPYTWGITGIIYNKELIAEGEDVNTWDVLWNEKYMGEILMFSNPRDAFGVAQKKLGYSLNTQEPDQLKDALDELKSQKPMVQAYVMDEIFDKMISGEAVLAPYYAGDAVTMMETNPNLDFSIPDEGVNIFVDAAAIPTGAPNPELAHMYINFLLEAQVAAANAEYIGYATPNNAAREYIPANILNNPIAYPSQEVIDKAEYYLMLPRETNILIDEYWTELLSSDQHYSKLLVPILLLIAIVATFAINILRSINKNKKQYYY